MSIPVLEQVYDETRRLAIAGSVVAPGDFRLRKLAPALEQAGKKAPVFAKVGQAVTAVVESTDKTSASVLLELSTLVNAILYTQGATGLAGEIAPIETIDLGQEQAQISARLLKPLLEALSTTGSGRQETVKDAFERGAFRDLRLVAPALAAIDDADPHIADFIAENVLPMYGRAILPELRETLDIKRRGGHIRRLKLMHQFDSEATRETVKNALDGGSQEMRVAALECLGDSPDDLPILLEHRKAKAERVRQAAYRSLVESDAPPAVAAICEAIQGDDLQYIQTPLQRNQNPTILRFLLDQAKAAGETLLASKEKDKAKVGKQAERLILLLQSIGSRADKLTEKLLLAMFADRQRLAMIKSEPGGKDVENTLLTVMSFGPKTAQLALVEVHTSLDDENLPLAFTAAVESFSPAEVLQKFGPYLTTGAVEKKKANDLAVRKRKALRDRLINFKYWRRPGNRPWVAGPNKQPELDPRWLDLAVKQEDLDLIEALAYPGHDGCHKFLRQAFEQKTKRLSSPSDELTQIARIMVQSQHPAATVSLLKLITKFWLWNHVHLIPELPKESLAQVEAILPTAPERNVDMVLRFVMELRARTS